MWSKWIAWLLVAERIALTLAALTAILPMWQYYSEREDRRLDRAANFISAYKTCVDVKSGASLTPSLTSIDMSGDGTVDFTLSLNSETFAPMAPDRTLTEVITDDINDQLRLLNEGISSHCRYIEAINQTEVDHRKSN